MADCCAETDWMKSERAMRTVSTRALARTPWTGWSICTFIYITEVLAVCQGENGMSSKSWGNQSIVCKHENPVGPPVKDEPPQQQEFTSVGSRELSSLGGEGSVKQIKRGAHMTWLVSHKFETFVQVVCAMSSFFPPNIPALDWLWTFDEENFHWFTHQRERVEGAQSSELSQLSFALPANVFHDQVTHHASQGRKLFWRFCVSNNDN